MLKINDMVQVYTDPFTKKNLEGRGTVTRIIQVRPQSDGTVMVSAMVQFDPADHDPIVRRDLVL